jgi:DNA mismatch repair ATPase MutS
MVTPARRQYLELKAQHPDAILWFRTGFLQVAVADALQYRADGRD